ncbi:MAG: hypothetical protein GY870_08815, partial [archaeon]|nr:hypothetical protein [archaeon]
YILGFMHKSDPDILDDPDFQLNTEYVADKMNYHLRNYGYEYDIYTTSIYNFFTSEPKFSRFIKETLSDKESLNNPVVRKIEGMGDILDSTLNAVVTLASSMGEQIAQLGRRIDELEVKIERTFMPLPKTTAEKRAQKLMPSHSPQVIYTKKTPSGQNITPNGKNAAPIDSRLTIMNELQSLFQAKKNLDDTTQLSKLGTLGKKFKKSKATKKTKKAKKSTKK